MKKFSKKLHVDNRENFHKLNYKRVLALFRKELFNHIVSHEEKDYCDVNEFRVKNRLSPEDVESMVTSVCEELKQLGWKTQTSFGGTGLFIYANEPPANCYPDGFE